MSIVYGLVEGVLVVAGLFGAAAFVLLIIMLVYNIGVGSRY